MKNSALFLLVILTLFGCSAMQTAVEYRELDVRSSLEKPVFLRNNPKTLHLKLDCPVVEFQELGSKLVAAYQFKGYKLVEEEVAGVVLNIRVGDAGSRKVSARAAQGRQDVTASAGALGGTAVGYMSSGGDPVSSIAAGIAGLTVGALADVTINSWVHLGMIDIRADVLVVEKLPAGEVKESVTSINVLARQSGLKWEEAAEPIEAELEKQLVLLLPSLN